MTVGLSADGAIQLDGACPIDEAELLQRLLLAHPEAVVDWRLCTHLHSALIQLLLASGRPVLGPARDEFLRTWIAPALQAFTP